MIRSIVLSIFGIMIGFSLLWVAYPMLTIGQQAVTPYVNSSDPVIASSLSLGNAWYLALGVIGIAVAAFILIARAHGDDN